MAATAALQHAPVPVSIHTPQRPPGDRSEWRYVTLQNGIHCLLISDPDAEKAAASADVRAGSLLDYPELPGLAHLLEHMLFYSSSKFPKEDEYSAFISQRGGRTNAYTAAEDTNYSFDINAEHLAPALDRFAQFFISPLISAEGVGREVNAVDSEHGKNLQLDAWRHLQLCKHCANAEHPWSRFSTGSLDTLSRTPASQGVNVRDALVDFHSKYYSANLMKLCVLGRQPLDALQALVEECFAAVLNHNLPVPAFGDNVLTEASRASLLRVVPVKKVHAVEWTWQVPPSAPQYKTCPLSYLAHLLGHEGHGSVYSLLRQRGWATSLVAGESGASISSASFFYCRIDLTEEGQQHVCDIGAVLFSYLGLIAREGITEAVHNEVRALNQLRLDYRDKQAPYNLVTSLSSAMQLYPDEDLLPALYHVPATWDPDSIRAALGCMTPEKARVIWTSQSHADVATDTEPWYGTKFLREVVPPEWLSAWQGAQHSSPLIPKDLHLPEPNPFVPSDLSLRTEDAVGPDAPPGPRVVREVPGLLKLWHRCDLTFPTPKAVVYVDVQAPEAYVTPRAAVCTRLLVSLLIDALSELSYPAQLAGLYYDVSNSQTGFLITVSGYSHKLPVLLGSILSTLEQLQVDDDRAAVMCEQLSRDYTNMKHSQPYQWAMYRRELLLNFKRWQVSEYEAVLPTITPDVLRAFKPRLLAQAYMEGLVVGNVSQAEAQALADQLLGHLQGPLAVQPVFPSQMRDLRPVRLPPGATVVLEEAGPDPVNTNTALSVMYQVGQEGPGPDLTRLALLELLVHLSKRDAFNVLRTQQQLGYIVHLFANQELGAHHLEVLVQSNVYSPAELLSRVDAFVRQLVTELLPAKCGAAPPRTAHTSAGTAESAAAGTGGTPSKSAEDSGGAARGDAGAGKGAVAAEPASHGAQQAQPSGAGGDEGAAAGGEGGSGGPAEFEQAVEELAKTLLEKPKRLGELAHRWWGEVFMGTHVFDRRDRLVSALRALTPQQLLDFAHNVLLHPCVRQKAVVAVHTTASAAAAVKGALPAGAGTGEQDAGIVTAGAGANEGTAKVHHAAPVHLATCGTDVPGGEVVRVRDVTEFRRSQGVYPSLAGMYALWSGTQEDQAAGGSKGTPVHKFVLGTGGADVAAPAKL